MSKLADVLTEDFLIEEYIKKEKSLKIIGEEAGCCSQTVLNYMRKFNITRRDSNYPTERTNWWNGKDYSLVVGEKRLREISLETSHRMKEHWKKHKHPKKGKKIPHPEDCGCPFCRASRGELVGEGNPFYGKTHSEEYRKWRSDFQLGENNPNWNGGSSYEKYPPEFNPILKRKIRKRDGQKCAVCGKRGRHVHHIDYDKYNCDESNLITLCGLCHGKTNSNREYWASFLSRVIRLKY